MSVFVIVHGAWGGGWEWSPVARLLRGRGHDVFTPTLTGTGDRAHATQGAYVRLATHVDDVVAVLEFEDLHDVVLCGASYGGMPATGAADRAASRIGILVYVDALVPDAGQSALDLLSTDFGDMVRFGLEEYGRSWRVPMMSELLAALLPADSLPDQVRADYVARIRGHPAVTFADSLSLTGCVDRVRRAFVRSTSGGLAEGMGADPTEACARRARARGWIYRDLAAPHPSQVFDPVGIADVLEELADLSSARPPDLTATEFGSTT